MEKLYLNGKRIPPSPHFFLSFRFFSFLFGFLFYHFFWFFYFIIFFWFFYLFLPITFIIRELILLAELDCERVFIPIAFAICSIPK